MLVLLVALAAAGAAVRRTRARPIPRPCIPTFPLLDADGVNVLESGEPVSTMQTCGACHDAEYIEGHSYHASVGLDHFMPPGQVPDGQPWDMSRSLFGRWDPIAYRYLTPQGDERFDLGTADWVQAARRAACGRRPGGAQPDGAPLTELEADARMIRRPAATTLQPARPPPGTGTSRARWR